MIAFHDFVTLQADATELLVTHNNFAHVRSQDAAAFVCKCCREIFDVVTRLIDRAVMRA